ncbi:Hypothetical predicted protein [Olea europaea subsp. europaea]|uniref:Uncharacterized protein n=1 Tax=Olea europaea subsp. europaea TaxID=158383 RepID=A0A8S0SHY0_OLEEU|nr:Hypothetical predicted protein [Olea europaea subsp. europaea]
MSRNGEDWFYSVTRARRSRNHLRRTQSDVTTSRSQSRADEPLEKGKLVDAVLKVVATEPSPSCNLKRFLESVIPSVPAQHLSKTTIRGWKTCNVEFQPYFVLGDLWESFQEWSAYGAGVPLLLNDSDSVVQYYVPYLSGIQLYADHSKSSAKSRRLGEESDGDSFGDSSSDGSSDYGQDRGGLNYSSRQYCYHCQSSDNPFRIDRLSVRDQNMAFLEGFSSDEGESGSSQGCLLFEYLERDQPYSREPLADKIYDLALRFPELKTLRSCDILQSSWISVAWYPIYRIPRGQALDTCFLTFHSLHTPVTGSQAMHPPIVTYPSEMDGVPRISLPVFGLASYKYKASLWTPNAGCQRQLANSLLQAADIWLKLRQVNHPDFHFFCR